MNISEDKILEIKQTADIHDVISEYVALKKAGKDYVGLCPFHEEKTASFTVSTDKQMYFCFGCGTAGDVFEFLMKKNGMSFLEAAKQLAARYGIDLPENGAPIKNYGTPKPPGARKQETEKKQEEIENQQPAATSASTTGQYPLPPELWQEKAGKLVAWAHEKLLANPAQLKILGARGINIETIKHFRLGWNPGKDGKDLFRPRESWGLPTEMKDDRKKKLWLPIGLVIPMFINPISINNQQSTTNKPVRLRIRRPNGSKPTYYIMPGSSMATWIMQRSKRVFVIVESELDGILLWQETRDITGIIPVGSAVTRPDLNAIKLLQKSAWILNALDSDAAGANALPWWTNHFSQHHRWPVPVGKDPGEAWQAGINLKQWITSGFPSGWNGRSSFDSNKKITQKFTGIKVKYGDVLTGQNKTGVNVFQGRAEAGDVTKIQPEAQFGSLPIDSQPKPSDSLQKLEKLLKQYPVTISSTKERVYLREVKTWVNKNPKVSKEISNLVFMTPDVFDYICNHPAKIITGDNLILK